MRAGLRVATADATAEAKRIKSQLNSLTDEVAGAAHPFWADRGKGVTLATLQDRTGQAHSFVETCRATLEKIHLALFPLDETPQEMKALLQRFRQGEAIDSFVRAQLIAGAEAALAIVKILYPSVDLAAVGRGPPPGPDGEPMTLTPYYHVARGPAESLIFLAEVGMQAQL